ncbi:hypothetical protein FACS189431_3510 [Alphaproteobacteria bacterium]|nr:hypothetical protein FACS189431_3510 [Alphaproteobacteria bacterium]
MKKCHMEPQVGNIPSPDRLQIPEIIERYLNIGEDKKQSAIEDIATRRFRIFDQLDPSLRDQLALNKVDRDDVFGDINQAELISALKWIDEGVADEQAEGELATLLVQQVRRFVSDHTRPDYMSRLSEIDKLRGERQYIFEPDEVFDWPDLSKKSD